MDLWRRVDQSGNSAEATRRNAVAEGVADRVELHTADMTALPFEDNRFDVVLSSFAIHNISGRAGRERERAEAHRALAWLGRQLQAVEDRSKEQSEVFQVLPDLVRQMFSATGKRPMYPVVVKLVELFFRPAQVAIFVAVPAERKLRLVEGAGLPDTLGKSAVLDYGQGAAAGTGLVLTPAGEILTNNHIIKDATRIRVTVVSTGSTYTASVVGTDPTDDVAVLRLSGAANLATARLASDAQASQVAVSRQPKTDATG